MIPSYLRIGQCEVIKPFSLSPVFSRIIGNIHMPPLSGQLNHIPGMSTFFSFRGVFACSKNHEARNPNLIHNQLVCLGVSVANSLFIRQGTHCSMPAPFPVIGILHIGAEYIMNHKSLVIIAPCPGVSDNNIRIPVYFSPQCIGFILRIKIRRQNHYASNRVHTVISIDKK